MVQIVESLEIMVWIVSVDLKNSLLVMKITNSAVFKIKTVVYGCTSLKRKKVVKLRNLQNGVQMLLLYMITNLVMGLVD